MSYFNTQQIIQNNTGEKPLNSALMSVLLHGIIIISLLKFIQPAQTIDARIMASSVVPVSIIRVQKTETIQKEIKELPPKTAPSEVKIERKFENTSMESTAGKVIDSDVVSEESGKKTEQVSVVRNVSVNGSRVPPIYPNRALRLNQEGTVVLHVLVDQEGRTGDIKIVKSSGFGLLDNAAVDAVRKWDFNPSTQEGQVIVSWVEVPVNFSIQS